MTFKKPYASWEPWTFLEEYKGKAFTGEWPTLPEMFRINVSRFGDYNCFTVFEPVSNPGQSTGEGSSLERITLTYRESLKIIESIARWLYSKGIRKGDRVALTGKNSPEWAVGYLGILFAGATVVPIDYQLRDEETDLLIKTAGAKILFVDEEKHAVYADRKGGLEEVVSLRKGFGTYLYDLDGPEASIEQATEHDLAAILFTSGTTGNPKGVMLTHQNLVSDCYLAQGTPLILNETDVFYAILPIHHAYCMLAVFIETISVGAEVVFGKKMVSAIMLKELREGKVTMLLGVPMLFNKLLAGILRGIKAKGKLVYCVIRLLMKISGIIKKVFRANPGKKLFGSVLKKASLSTLRIGICGGGPLAPSVFRKFNQLGIHFVQGYGLTETSPIINLNPVEHYKETSVGKVVPGVDMKILNPDERGVGEVILKGPMVMKGYYGMPEETSATFTSDGYLKTGDLGYLDSENYLYLTGRAKNMIVTDGGKNVYPEEIENEFQLYDEIDQIMVRGFVVDKEMKIESIEALVYPSIDFFKTNTPDGKESSDSESIKALIKSRISAIISEVNQKILPYQRITRTIVLDEPMEMTTTKKIKRGNV